METVKTENLSQFDPIDEVDDIEVCCFKYFTLMSGITGTFSSTKHNLRFITQRASRKIRFESFLRQTSAATNEFTTVNVFQEKHIRHCNSRKAKATKRGTLNNFGVVQIPR